MKLETDKTLQPAETAAAGASGWSGGRAGDRGGRRAAARALLRDRRVDRRDLAPVRDVRAWLPRRPRGTLARMAAPRSCRAADASPRLRRAGPAGRARVRLAARRPRRRAGHPAARDGRDDSRRRRHRARAARRVGARLPARVPLLRRADRRGADPAAHELHRRLHGGDASARGYPRLPRGHLLHHPVRQVVGSRRVQRAALPDRVGDRRLPLRLPELPGRRQEIALRRRLDRRADRRQRPARFHDRDDRPLQRHEARARDRPLHLRLGVLRHRDGGALLGRVVLARAGAGRRASRAHDRRCPYRSRGACCPPRWPRSR